MTGGNRPNWRSHSVFAVCTQATSASGNPQNHPESPRTKRPSARSNSALGAGSGMGAKAKLETRNSKFEARSAELDNSINPENCGLRMGLVRISDFRFASDFGFRISDFEASAPG
jgi:hypothetical protein